MSVTGDYTSILPRAALLELVKSIIKCGVAQGYIRSDYILRGYRDLDSTACPGNAFYAEIKQWPNYQTNSTIRSVDRRSFTVVEDFQDDAPPASF
ncbi:unnamed protein product [Didymodactylos carnosus]|uniref:Uncharacterized protein n=1 Tax=Didymodactylos carnosus TaxID=1234261 RepID=A0A815RKS9_9BILA|nr:unnamed protein product [Didymodactylos carnosus]CAF1583790.1 unnamed protein product [Didymodactylos carnosus]CAF4342447.1 unnamed protein product [Didymodactylos carnosus]CAF4384172.1 unnamed protein product [Didymodactylos carnosus]